MIIFILLASFSTLNCYHFHLPLVTDDFQFIIKSMTRLNPHNIPTPLIIILNIFIRRFDRSLPKFFELAESEICEEQPEPVMAEYDGDYIEIKQEQIVLERSARLILDPGRVRVTGETDDHLQVAGSAG